MRVWASAAEIAQAVADGKTTAVEVAQAALARIAERDKTLNAFTAVTRERALAKARAIDAAWPRAARWVRSPACRSPSRTCSTSPASPRSPAPRSTATGRRPPPTATLITRLEAAGAVLVGALNMGEYAYDFTGENVHYGPSRNPHDTSRMTGGSSGGTGGAVAGGLVPIALGSDTNGSIRVPSSFCGLFGLKPTYGRLSRAGTFPFVSSFDHLGPLARSARDLALAYDAMQGHDPEDPVCAERAPEPALPLIGRGLSGLRIAVAGGHFERGAAPEALAAVARVAKALDATRKIEIPQAGLARAAAFVISTSEGASLHLERLRTRAADFDPAVRDRLFAGAFVPASLVVKAQKFRRWYRAEVLKLFEGVDAILAPATPFPAPRIGQQTMMLEGVEVPLRPNIGIFTQPISFIGLPVVAVPVPLAPLPIGVQIIAAPWREDVALRIAHALQESNAVAAPQPAE